MIDAPSLQVLSEHMGDLLPPMPGLTRLEMQRRVLHAQRSNAAALDPVTRTEFEALRLLLRYLREHLDTLGPRLAALERLHSLGTSHTTVTGSSLDSARSAISRTAP